MICVSTLLLTMDTPFRSPTSTTELVKEQLDVVITWLFCAEAALKILVYGFLCNGKDSYLRNSWNIMDFLIVVVSIISMMNFGEF